MQKMQFIQEKIYKLEDGGDFSDSEEGDGKKVEVDMEEF